MTNPTSSDSESEQRWKEKQVWLTTRGVALLQLLRGPDYSGGNTDISMLKMLVTEKTRAFLSKHFAVWEWGGARNESLDDILKDRRLQAEAAKELLLNHEELDHFTGHVEQGLRAICRLHNNSFVFVSVDGQLGEDALELGRTFAWLLGASGLKLLKLYQIPFKYEDFQ